MMRWLQYDHALRGKHLPFLLPHVKACLLLPQERVRIQLCSPLTPKEALFVHYGVGVGVISDLYAGERHDGQSYLNSMERSPACLLTE
ncbi:hypothetical protein ECG_07390 [Echinococcus granulosus]|nr:hypothetical protein ECG_07390 [Echinococcus granulosus]